MYSASFCCCILMRSAVFRYILLRSASFCCILLRSASFCCIPLRSAAFCFVLLHSALVCFVLLYSASFCCILLRFVAFCCVPLIFCRIPLHRSFVLPELRFILAALHIPFHIALQMLYRCFIDALHKPPLRFLGASHFLEADGKLKKQTKKRVGITGMKVRSVASYYVLSTFSQFIITSFNSSTLCDFRRQPEGTPRFSRLRTRPRR
jgi:hypothetical protein